MHWYLYVLLFVKLTFFYFLLKEKRNPSSENEKKLSLIDKAFMFLLSLLMIYLFHPFTKNPVCIDRETKLFLFTFAILTITHTF
jgi:hypothetical protein